MIPAATKRLTFRCWRDDDLPHAMTLWGDPRVTALVGDPFSEAEVRARLASEIETQRVHGYQYWVISLHDGTDIGCCGFRPRSADMLELGYYLRPEMWGQGLAIEAAGSAIEHAFTLPIVGLFAGHHPDNAASRRILLGLGFRYVFDEVYPPTGMMHPGYELRRS